MARKASSGRAGKPVTNSSKGVPKQGSAALSTQAQPLAPAPVSSAPPMSSGGGGGFLSNIVGTAVGSAAGHVVGRGIADTLFGSRSTATTSSGPPPISSENRNQKSGACQDYEQSFRQCLSSRSDAQSCQPLFDRLTFCQTQERPEPTLI